MTRFVKPAKIMPRNNAEDTRIVAEQKIEDRRIVAEQRLAGFREDRRHIRAIPRQEGN